MQRDLHEDITFRNVAGGKITLYTHGIKEFKDQAEMSNLLFKERKQVIDTMDFNGDTVEVGISYSGLLATELFGHKAGEMIHLKGKSVFVFKDNKISSITDVICMLT